MSRRRFGLLLVAMVLLAACTRPAPEPARREAATSKTHEGRGRVVEIDKLGRYIVLRHQEIPGFMDAMTMPFHLASAELVRSVAEGDEVEFTLEEKPDGVVLTRIRKLPSP